MKLCVFLDFHKIIYSFSTYRFIVQVSNLFPLERLEQQGKISEHPECDRHHDEHAEVEEHLVLEETRAPILKAATSANSTQTYHIKRVRRENVLSCVIDAVAIHITITITIHTAETLSVLALNLVALPLVDEEDLVGVVEPADVLDPRQPRGDQLGVGEEAAEQQEGEDEGGAYRGGNVDVWSQTGYEVPCS